MAMGVCIIGEVKLEKRPKSKRSRLPVTVAPFGESPMYFYLSSRSFYGRCDGFDGDM